MTLDDFLAALGYAGSPQFLRRGDQRFETQPAYGHIFRRARDKDESNPSWQVEGVYGLRDPNAAVEKFVPIVYVCNATTDIAVKEVHRLVWNQDVVPYVLVYEPKGVRVYAGFHFAPRAKTEREEGVIYALTDFNNASSIIRLFEAASVDSGGIWRNSDAQVDPGRRVYHQLLKNLQLLDKWLRKEGLKKEVSHSLIGKYVYLRYLRDRAILSNERLTEVWGVQEGEVFGRNATKSGLEKVTNHLDEWLNGEVFPMAFHGANSPTAEHIRRVAAIFDGDEMSGQQALNFQIYDFSYIPIETLSLIYEQFLHSESEDEVRARKSKGREAGAYYTPLPVVNFMLAELNERLPLREGMKVCDPSCGSGAFLVQTFRTLVERTFPATGPRPKPGQLRALLESSIYGVDIDQDACQVTQLSLILTLLDYVQPPDLTGRSSAFKLPSLIGKNIFCKDFFSAEEELRDCAPNGFNWVVGNPPWKPLKEDQISAGGKAAWEWMQRNSESCPVSKYQLAQAFAWEAPRHLAAKGECALLVPAIGLFEEPSVEFRKSFFARFRVHDIANFANLAEVLFDGRSRVPAACLFFQNRPENVVERDETITFYSPFVANQEATRPLESGERRKLWSICVNGSEIRYVDIDDAISGSGLPWKIAMWGTPWDERLVNRLERKWISFGDLERKNVIIASEGIQLRDRPPDYTGEPLEAVDEVRGKLLLDVDVLKGKRDIFAFPKEALIRLDEGPKYARKRGGIQLPLAVCRPPHVIVSAARNFAVYCEEFIVVPPRQIGIISTGADRRFLKALALFLSSDFAFYHQFIRASQFGVQRAVATFEALRKLPIPLANLKPAKLDEWAELHDELVTCPPRTLDEKATAAGQRDLFKGESPPIESLLARLNELTAEALGLNDRERVLVHDLVKIRFELNDGKQGAEAVRPATDAELGSYAQRLKQELDAFVGSHADRVHSVKIVRDNASGAAAVEIDFTKDTSAIKINILQASSTAGKAFQRTRDQLLENRKQWVYFNRNLRVYRGHQTYIFKPLQRFHWTESAAMMDASDIIAETLSAPA